MACEKTNPRRFGLISGPKNRTWHIARCLTQPPACLTLPSTCPSVFSLALSLVPWFIRWQVIFSMGAQVPFPQRVRERYIPNPKLPLYEQCHEVMRFKQLALRPEIPICNGSSAS